MSSTRRRSKCRLRPNPPPPPTPACLQRVLRQPELEKYSSGSVAFVGIEAQSSKIRVAKIGPPRGGRDHHPRTGLSGHRPLKHFSSVISRPPAQPVPASAEKALLMVAVSRLESEAALLLSPVKYLSAVSGSLPRAGSRFAISGMSQQKL